MPETKTPPVAIVDFRAEQYSPDGKAIIVSFATAESAERRSYTLPVQSLYGFIADLQQLPSAGRPTAATPPASPPPPVAPAPPAALNQVQVTVPKSWMTKALPERKLVVMVFDPQTEKQIAYALPPEAARAMAETLVKQVEKLATTTPDKAMKAN